jgi:hypothetical protein
MGLGLEAWLKDFHEPTWLRGKEQVENENARSPVGAGLGNKPAHV